MGKTAKRGSAGGGKDRKITIRRPRGRPKKLDTPHPTTSSRQGGPVKIVVHKTKNPDPTGNRNRIKPGVKVVGNGPEQNKSEARGLEASGGLMLEIHVLVHNGIISTVARGERFKLVKYALLNRFNIVPNGITYFGSVGSQGDQLLQQWLAEVQQEGPLPDNIIDLVAPRLPFEPEP